MSRTELIVAVVFIGLAAAMTLRRGMGGDMSTDMARAGRRSGSSARGAVGFLANVGILGAAALVCGHAVGWIRFDIVGWLKTALGIA